MQQQDLIPLRRRKHKTQFFICDKDQQRPIRPKRLSCMGASEYLMMEESKIDIVNICVEQILQNVFDSVNQAKAVSELCMRQLEEKFELIQNYDLFNMEDPSQQAVVIVNLQEQPKAQQRFKVATKKQKCEEQSFNINKKELLGLLHNISSNSKGNQMISGQQKISKLTNSSNFNPKHSIMSINSIKSRSGHSFVSIRNQNASTITQEKQNSSEKEKRRKEQIIKKLMKQHQQKIKETHHFGPELILQKYRSFFTQPTTREQEDMRSSFLNLRELKEMQQKLNHQKMSKKMFNSMLNTDITNKENLTASKLPSIYKSNKPDTNKDNLLLFAQDQNGSLIKIKNQHRIQTQVREPSTIPHEKLSKKLKDSLLKHASNISIPRYECLKNEKIQNESNLVNQNLSIMSTICQSMDEEMMERSLMKNISHNKGITLKKSTSTHRQPMSAEIKGLKLPSILSKKI